MFNREHEVLSAMREVRSKHLITRLAAFKDMDSSTVGGFLFPWAQADLNGFWHQNSDQHRVEEIHRWAFLQLKGISEALRDLDTMYGQSQKNIRHGDLKPGNILWLPGNNGLGYLAIADAGLAKVHGQPTRYRFGPTTTIFASKPYAAPETTGMAPKMPTSRKFDMWSMGCICIEFIVWLMYGDSELQRFTFGQTTPRSDKRVFKSFYTYNVKHAFKSTLHPHVTRWTDHIRNDEGCGATTALRALLDLALQHLLVAETKSRCSSDYFATEMGSINSQFEQRSLTFRTASRSIGPLDPSPTGSCGLLSWLVQPRGVQDTMVRPNRLNGS